MISLHWETRATHLKTGYGNRSLDPADQPGYSGMRRPLLPGRPLHTINRHQREIHKIARVMYCEITREDLYFNRIEKCDAGGCGGNMYVTAKDKGQKDD